MTKLMAIIAGLLLSTAALAYPCQQMLKQGAQLAKLAYDARVLAGKNWVTSKDHIFEGEYEQALESNKVGLIMTNQSIKAYTKAVTAFEKVYYNCTNPWDEQAEKFQKLAEKELEEVKNIKAALKKQKDALDEILSLNDEKMNTCYAYTQCWDGRLIQCTTYGPACTFNSVYGQSVSCSGFNAYGQWVNLWATCQ